MFGTSPYGSAPFGSTGGPSAPPVLELTESIGFIPNLTGISATPLNDGFGANDLASSALIHLLAEQISLTGSPVGNLNALARATDNVRFTQALASMWQLMVAEGIGFAGDAAGHPVKVGALVDAIHLTGLVDTRLDALAIVTTVLAVNGLTATGWKLDAIDSIGFQDALAASLKAVTAVLDGIGFADLPAQALRLTAVAAESLALADSPTGSLEMFAALQEDVLLYTTLRLGAEEYSGWVLNEGAPSEYRNYPFNGMIEWGGRYYGTADDGLYLLEGADDAGQPIDGFIKTALLDFGTGKLKRLPDVYVAFAGGNQLVLKVIAVDDSGERQEHVYTAAVPPGTGMHNGRIKVGRGLKATYWQFVLANVDGDALDLDKLSFRPLVLDRRI